MAATSSIFKNLSFIPQSEINFEIGSMTTKLSPPNKALTRDPRPPLIQVIRRSHNTKRLYVYTINFVANNNNPLLFSGTHTTPASDATKLNINISYDIIPEPSSTFGVYQICFILDNIPATVTTVELTLTNSDPEESRGTETTVQLLNS